MNEYIYTYTYIRPHTRSNISRLLYTVSRESSYLDTMQLSPDARTGIIDRVTYALGLDPAYVRSSVKHLEEKQLSDLRQQAKLYKIENPGTMRKAEIIEKIIMRASTHHATSLQIPSRSGRSRHIWRCTSELRRKEHKQVFLATLHVVFGVILIRCQPVSHGEQ